MPKKNKIRFRPSSKPSSPLKIVNFMLAFALIGVAYLIFASAAILVGYYGSVENDQVSRINSARAVVGKSAYQHIECLNSVAESWAKKMSDAKDVSHNPNLVNDVKSKCGSGRGELGENVGVGWDSKSLFDAFMSSPAHKANILSTCTYYWDKDGNPYTAPVLTTCAFKKVGLGAYKSSDGRIWVAQVFANCITCSGTWATNASLPEDPQSVPLNFQSLKADFNGDGYSDIFYYAPGTADDSLWYGTSTRGTFNRYSKEVDVNYRPVAGDFDGDGKDDIYWYSPGTASDVMWFGTSTKGTMTSVKMSNNVTGTYIPVAGDFNGDGKSDVIFYAPGDATDHIHFGTSTRGSLDRSNSNITIGSLLAGIPGDYNGDGKDDVFWYGPGSAPDAVWYGTATKSSFSKYTQTVSGSYRPTPGDFDGDGKDDILWYGPGSAVESIWSGHSTKGSWAKGSSPSVSGSYTPIPGNFDNDKYDDIFWYAPGSGAERVWWGTATRGNLTSTAGQNVSGTYITVP